MAKKGGGSSKGGPSKGSSRPHNGPSTTGNDSGRGRGNNAPKSGSGKK